MSGSNDGTIKVWDLVKWSRKDHLMFNDTTQRFVLLLLWLNKYSMKFPDDVLEIYSSKLAFLLAKQVRRGDGNRVSPSYFSSLF